MLLSDEKFAMTKKSVAIITALVAMSFVLFWLSGKPPEGIRLERTNRQLGTFAGLLVRSCSKHDLVPKTLEEAVAKVRHNLPTEEEKHYRMLIENRDAWGKPFSYTVSKDEEMGIMIISISSQGPASGRELKVDVWVDVLDGTSPPSDPNMEPKSDANNSVIQEGDK